MTPLGFSSVSVRVASRLVRKSGSISVSDVVIPFKLADGTPSSTVPRPSAQVGDATSVANATSPRVGDKRIMVPPHCNLKGNRKAVRLAEIQRRGHCQG